MTKPDTDIRQRRPHYLGQTNFYNLNSACRTVLSAFAFGYGVFLVGSALRTKDYRDVDVRVMLPDEKFVALFPDYKHNSPDPYWNFVCTSISEWLQVADGTACGLSDPESKPGESGISFRRESPQCFGPHLMSNESLNQTNRSVAA